MNKEQLLKAAEVMRRAAEGEIVEVHQTDGWKIIRWGEPTWNWGSYDYRILDFPPGNWHNPTALNATQVGVHKGWRLLLVEETSGKDKIPENFECHDRGWEPRGRIFYHAQWALFPTHTYRTKSPLPSPPVDAFDELWPQLNEKQLCLVRMWTGNALEFRKEVAKVVWEEARQHFTQSKL